jgi:hypothetical protein
MFHLCQVEDKRIPKESEATAVTILSFIKAMLEEPNLQKHLTFSPGLYKLIVELSFDGVKIAGAGTLLAFLHMRDYLVTVCCFGVDDGDAVGVDVEIGVDVVNVDVDVDVVDGSVRVGVVAMMLLTFMLMYGLKSSVVLVGCVL